MHTGADRDGIDAELERARAKFRALLESATDADLRRRSNGTRWTNEELLFHIVFGYMVVRALLVVVRLFGVLPDGASKVYARILDAGTGPFDVVNYWGSRAAATAKGSFGGMPQAKHLAGVFEQDLARGG